jgi:TatA/E family protein of Tat protein translocase
MELIVIFMVILVLFGPRRLPEIAKMIGKTLQELRRASEDFKDQVLSIETVESVVPESLEDEDYSEDSSEDYDGALEGEDYGEDLHDEQAGDDADAPNDAEEPPDGVRPGIEDVDEKREARDDLAG